MGENGHDPTLDPICYLGTSPILKFIASFAVPQLSRFLSSPEPSRSPSPGSRWVQGHPNSWERGHKSPPKSASSLGGGAADSAMGSGQTARRCAGTGWPPRELGRRKRSPGAHRGTPGVAETRESGRLLWLIVTSWDARKCHLGELV